MEKESLDSGSVFSCLSDYIDEEMKDAVSRLDLEQQKEVLARYHQDRKDPKKSLFLSRFWGFFGADRFYINHKIYGITKLVMTISIFICYLIRLSLIEKDQVLYNSEILFFGILSYVFFQLALVMWLVDLFLIKKKTKIYNKNFFLKLVDEKIKNDLSDLDLDHKNEVLARYNQVKKNPKKALFLSIFLGFLGVDRFYIKHKTYGSIKLLVFLSSPLAYGLGLGIAYLLAAVGNDFVDENSYFYPVSILNIIRVFIYGYLILYRFIFVWMIPILWVIDIFLIKKATEEYNEKNFIKIIRETKEGWGDAASTKL